MNIVIAYLMVFIEGIIIGSCFTRYLMKTQIKEPEIKYCLHCDKEEEPLYCENCYQELLSENVKLQGQTYCYKATLKELENKEVNNDK